MSFKQPFYTLKISSQNCGFQITVNGCTVENHKENTPLTIEHPINQWLKNGDNEIAVHFLNTRNPVDRKKYLASNCKLNCTLQVKEHGTDIETHASTIAFNGAALPRVLDSVKIDYNQEDKINDTFKASTSMGNYTLSNNQYITDRNGELFIDETKAQLGPRKCLLLTQNITLQIPFAEWAFFSGDDAEKLEQEMTDEEWEKNSDEFLIHYQKLWDLINTENFDELSKHLQIRFNEYDQAFYRTPGDSEKQLFHSLKSAMADKDWPLKPLKPEDGGISVSFNKKITWLHGGNDILDGLICFEHTSSDLAKIFAFYFSKINGEWVVVR